jgi:hypothetical protein
MNIEQFDNSTDLNQVILWQYNVATHLQSLLSQKQAWYDVNQSDFWTLYYQNIFNLSATNNNVSFFGLAVWSIILNVPLFIPVEPVEPGVVWGFNAFQTVIQTGTLNATTTVTGLSDTSVLLVGMQVSGTFIQAGTTIASITNSTTLVLSLAATNSGSESLTFTGWPDYENDNLNFNNAPFAPTHPIIILTIAQQHFLLLLKYFNCTNRGTLSWPIGFNLFNNDKSANNIYTNNFVYNINQFLQYLCFNLGDAIGYGTNTIYCHDNLDMTISYVFSDLSAFPPNLLIAIQTLDLLPRPSGVAIV